MKTVLDVLKERGFIEAYTSNEVFEIVKDPVNFYIGFDPTADSLHIGNMVGMMAAAWFQKFGHKPILIVGGATGMIGDPSGKSLERNLLDEKTLQKNLEGITRSLATMLNVEHVLNNYEWFKEFTFIHFLRDVGKNFRLGTMLAKDSVKSRLNSEEGLSFTEFSYQLLQAYDFLHLFDTKSVTLQIGGSDQWGNITAGTELVRRVRGKTVHGLTFPLLTRSDGKKFGKSEEGTIWINSEKLNPYDFYQYFIRIPDADVIKLLKMLTFLELDEISQLEEEMKTPGYHPNSAQKRLAQEVTKIVHGEVGLQFARKITTAAAPGAKTQLDAATLSQLAHEHKATDLPLDQVEKAKIVDLIVKAEGAPSKGEARRLIQNGGVYLNNEKISDENYHLEKKDIIESKFVLIAIGKKKKVVIKIAEG
jgi:tyrosyl-tRNA synthetase